MEMNDDSLEVQSEDRAAWKRTLVFRWERRRSDEVRDEPAPGAIVEWSLDTPVTGTSYDLVPVKKWHPC